MPATIEPAGTIEPNVMYMLPALQKQTGLGVRAIRHMRRHGLRVRYVGTRAFIKGADFIEHIEKHGRDEK